MKAMILAAGLGRRMRPLTDHLPKPLLPLAGKPLIEYHLEALSLVGVEEVVINVSYLAEQIVSALGDGSRWGLSIQYSHEREPLETGGGIARALPFLGEAPFLLVNGDVWTDFAFSNLISSLPADSDAHLLMVSNPEHNPEGDFALDGEHLALLGRSAVGFTYGGLAVIRPALISDYSTDHPVFPLREVFVDAIARGKLSGQLYEGGWCDVGTPQRLSQLEQQLLGAN